MSTKYLVKIKCITLFDITRSGVNTRRHEHGVTDSQYQKKRSQQSNFETILQIVGLRSQPEEISDPEKSMVIPSKIGLGSEYQTKTKMPAWSFTFNVEHAEVFSEINNDLQKLSQDCVGVPMITMLEEHSDLGKMLDISKEFKNIHFEVIQ